MTKKAKIIDSLLSISILLDRTLEDVTYGEVRPFCTHELRKVRGLCKSLPFADEIENLIDGALAYSDSIESFSYAVDEVLVAVKSL